MRCPCGSGDVYGDCCGRFHRGLASGEAKAPTAERLMRSRFSAFAVGDTAYLLATWHLSTRPAALDLGTGHTWTRLDILGATAGGFLDSEGTVEFVAQYRDDVTESSGRRGRQHETSRFVREEGFWFYLDGFTGGSGH